MAPFPVARASADLQLIMMGFSGLSQKQNAAGLKPLGNAEGVGMGACRGLYDARRTPVIDAGQLRLGHGQCMRVPGIAGRWKGIGVAGRRGTGVALAPGCD